MTQIGKKQEVVVVEPMPATVPIVPATLPVREPVLVPAKKEHDDGAVQVR